MIGDRFSPTNGVNLAVDKIGGRFSLQHGIDLKVDMIDDDNWHDSWINEL